MAFSTQKDFFQVPFMNEQLEFECKKACVKLKSYNSTIDDRSWALDEAKQSKFLTDLVTCQTPVGLDGDGGRGGSSRGRGEAAGGTGKNALEQQGMLPAGDSLIHAATANLAQLENMLLEKESLQKQLEVSKEHLQTAKMENQKIKEIMNSKYDPNNSKEFYSKIQKLSCNGKLSKTEEAELMQLYKKMEDMNKAYEVLQAEGSYLRVLVEKLSRRVPMESIKCELEKSTDIAYLQDQVNKLRKETMILRKYEDNRLMAENKHHPPVSDRDAEGIQAILKERNALREKCKTFKELEKKVAELQKKAKEADHMSEGLSNNLDSQSKYILEMEQTIQRMQNFYEEQLQNMKFKEDELKYRLNELKEELIQAKCMAQKAECLQMEIGTLRNDKLKLEVALGEYDFQYKQLMYKTKLFKSSGYHMSSPSSDKVGYDNNCMCK